MKFGVTTFPTDYSIDVATLGRALEERAFESLFFSEHTHIPASRRTPYPAGGDLPKQYYHTLDPFVALGIAAASTSRLMLGTGICLVTEHDPIVLAKAVATLDFVSGGRFIFGVGAGWNIEELESHGTNPDSRWTLLRERVQAMKQIWTQDEADYHGRLVEFDPLWSWPKPLQKPHPPVYVGGWGPHTMNRVVDYGDGYMPIVIPGLPPLKEQVPVLQQMAQEAGRPPIPVTAFWAPPDPEVVADYEAAGVERCLFDLPSLPEDETLSVLDRFAALMREATTAGA